MIAVIRIAGKIGLNHKIDETLHRMYIRRKYALTLIKSTKENLALLKKVRNQVAFGEINENTLIKLIEVRAQSLEKSQKIEAKKIAASLETKTLKELGLKPFFRLHPPRGGIDSKRHFGSKKGVLGDNKDKINDLIGRML